MTRFLLFILLVLPSTAGWGQASQIYTYMWNPRTEDVGSGGSKDFQLLKSLLLLTLPKEYTVQPGDSLDYIIRKQFFVSQQYSNAYALYIKRVLNLNSNLSIKSILHPGDVIKLPGGPRFGASELKNLEVSSPLGNRVFLALSRRAHQVSPPKSTEALNRLKTLSARSLAAYVAPTAQGSVSALYSSIKRRGLIYPIDFKKYPEARLAQTEALELRPDITGASAAISSLIKIDPLHLWPGLFPVSAPLQVECGTQCTRCADGLGIPNNIDLTRARVLVEDTGISPGYIDAKHLLKRDDKDDGADQSQVSHGTFVYSQIAAGPSEKLYGAIPQDNVYVAKTVREVDGTLYFDMADIVKGWTAFSERMLADNGAAKTWVVNISAYGEPVPDLNHPPAIPNDGHMLIVAAAGNDHQENGPALKAFPRLSNGASTLLVAGALGTDQKPTSYSNWNPVYVQLFAQGDCTCGSPEEINGTSQAAPFVSTAAAVIAAAHPDWNPLYVMWRLLSTADHPDFLTGKAFAGTINLKRALEDKILVTEQRNGASPSIHRATAIHYDNSWKTAFVSRGINRLDKETLRLYSPMPGTVPNQVCFTALQKLYYDSQLLCIDSGAQITLTEAGASVTLKASQILDVSIPLPDPNDDGSNLPDMELGSPQ